MVDNKPNTDILKNLSKFVQEEIDKESIPKDHTWAVVGGLDNNGLKVMAAVAISKGEKVETKVKAIWEHDWDGNNTAGLCLVISGK